MSVACWMAMLALVLLTDERSIFLEPCHRMCLNSVRTRLYTSSTVTQQGKTTPAVYNVYTRSDPPEEDKIPPE